MSHVSSGLLRPALVCFLLDIFETCIDHTAPFSVNTPFGLYDLALTRRGCGAIDEEGASGDTQLNSKSARRGEKEIGVILELSPPTVQKRLTLE